MLYTQFANIFGLEVYCWLVASLCTRYAANCLFIEQSVCLVVLNPPGNMSRAAILWWDVISVEPQRPRILKEKRKEKGQIPRRKPSKLRRNVRISICMYIVLSATFQRVIWLDLLHWSNPVGSTGPANMDPTIWPIQFGSHYLCAILLVFTKSFTHCTWPHYRFFLQILFNFFQDVRL